MEVSRTGRRGALHLSGTLVASAVALVQSAVLGRWLSVDDHGLVVGFIATVGALALLAQGGAVGAVVDARARGGLDGAEARGLALGLLAVPLTLTCAVAWWAGMLDVVGVVALIGWVAWQVLGGLARADGRFAQWGTAQVAQAAGRLVATVFALLWAPTAAAATAAFAMGTWLGVAPLAPWVGRVARPAPEQWQRGRRFAQHAGPWAVAMAVTERADVLMLGVLGAAQADIALAGVAIAVSQRTRLIPTALGVALAVETEPKAGTLTRQALRGAVATAVALAVVGAVAVPWLWGAAYNDAVTLLWLSLPGQVALGMVTVWGRIGQATHRGRRVAAVGLGALVLHGVLAAVVWRGGGGVAGVVAAGSVAQMISLALSRAVVVRK